MQTTIYTNQMHAFCLTECKKYLDPFAYYNLRSSCKYFEKQLESQKHLYTRIKNIFLHSTRSNIRLEDFHLLSTKNLSQLVQAISEKNEEGRPVYLKFDCPYAALCDQMNHIFQLYNIDKISDSGYQFINAIVKKIKFDIFNYSEIKSETRKNIYVHAELDQILKAVREMENILDFRKEPLSITKTKDLLKIISSSEIFTKLLYKRESIAHIVALGIFKANCLHEITDDKEILCLSRYFKLKISEKLETFREPVQQAINKQSLHKFFFELQQMTASGRFDCTPILAQVKKFLPSEIENTRGRKSESIDRNIFLRILQIFINTATESTCKDELKKIRKLY